ncbi:MAG: ATP-dependent DNA helicase RecG [Bacteroidetes bacterium]|nr:ATP-dependent DNA helicase RecG [Bacteroidota bacterium]
MTLETSIEYIKGIGQERAVLINSVLGIKTVEDFLYFFPNRYLDRSKVYKVNEIQAQESVEILMKGKIWDLKELGTGKGHRLTAKFSDGTGTLDLVWFKFSKWLMNQIPQNTEVFIFGRVNHFNGYWSMSHPEIELDEQKENDNYLRPLYPSSEKLIKRKLNHKFFQNTLKIICTHIPQLIEENIPENIIQRHQLMSRPLAFLNIHFPQNYSYYEAAQKRLKFEEAFFFQLRFGLKKQQHKTHAVGHPFPIVGDYFNHFYQNSLPFELTLAQKRVLKEIRNDLKKNRQMNRLLQGDVGSGKTMVALLTMLLAMDNGFQSCLMAPTEILATQHYNGIADLLHDSPIQVKLLTGSTKAAERRKIHQDLLSGALSILVGTHAVLEKKVEFKNLGLAIIDEQHRFGVAQRASLWSKNTIPPHILVMTATPIPRTLAMSFYSDLDVSVIDELPLGRKPIITAHRKERDRISVYQFAKEELKKGRQIYFVYPLIEESESLDYKNLMEGFEQIAHDFQGIPISMVHGKMKPEEKDQQMKEFVAGRTKIMVATTVIEVGVNVPNASVMVIESAERFGLSQLHQLRGRVGRGAEQSYCILMTSDKMSQESRKRIKTMCDTNDGFKISEVDMQLRGPGDLLGTQQSGVIDFKQLDLTKDGIIIQQTKDAVEQLLMQDPLFLLPQHQKMKAFFIHQQKKKGHWSKIS